MGPGTMSRGGTNAETAPGGGVTLEPWAAQLREEHQRAVVEDTTTKLAPVLERIIGYVDHVDGVGSRDPIDQQEELIDAEAAGKMLGHGRRYMWDHAKEFPFAYQIGRHWKYSPSGIRRYLKRRAA